MSKNYTIRDRLVKQGRAPTEDIKVYTFFNNTNIPLTDGTTFTGTVEQIPQHTSAIHVKIISDQPGVLTIYQSLDGIEFDIIQVFDIVENIHNFFSIKKAGQQFFVSILNNSGTDMTKLKCRVNFKKYPEHVTIENSNLPVTFSNTSIDANITNTPDVHVTNTPNVTFTNTSIDSNITNSSLAVSNAALTSMNFTGGKLNTETNIINNNLPVTFSNTSINANITNSAVPISNAKIDALTVTSGVLSTNFTNTSINANITNASLPITHSKLDALTVTSGVLSTSISNTPSVTFTNSSLAVTNSALTSMGFTSGKLNVNQNVLSNTTDNVQIYGQDSGLTKRAILTNNLGQLIVEAPTQIVTSVLSYQFSNANANANTAVISNGNIYIHGFTYFNLASQDCYLKIYNRNSTTALSSVTPNMIYKVSGNQKSENIMFPSPIQFSSGLVVRATQFIGTLSGGAYQYDDVTQPDQPIYFTVIWQ